MTIYVVLREKLGREPTNLELKEECLRIIGEAQMRGVKSPPQNQKKKATAK